jgi:hypothetical protein
VHQAQQGAQCPFCRATVVSLELVGPPAKVTLGPAASACSWDLLSTGAWRLSTGAWRRQRVEPVVVSSRFTGSQAT